MLTVHLGFGRTSPPPDLSEERRVRYTDAIACPAERAARLTSQILAFSHWQWLNRELILTDGFSDVLAHDGRHGFDLVQKLYLIAQPHVKCFHFRNEVVAKRRSGPYRACMTQPLSVMVIEDEPLIAMMLEDFIDLLGHRLAASADSIEAALPLIAEGGIDAAILDVNLRDGPCWRVADALSAQGVPFVIATGGHVDPPPATYAGVPNLPKPFTIDGVRTALESLSS